MTRCLTFKTSRIGEGSYEVAEGEGFEPPVTEATVVFKTTALNRSATPPSFSLQFTVPG
jgi:hypothetical protein